MKIKDILAENKNINESPLRKGVGTQALRDALIQLKRRPLGKVFSDKIKGGRRVKAQLAELPNVAKDKLTRIVKDEFEKYGLTVTKVHVVPEDGPWSAHVAVTFTGEED